MILAADIGGTKVNIALFAAPSSKADADQSPPPVHKGQYSSQDYPGFAEVAREFLKSSGVAPERVKRACIGVAGPVVQGRVETSNLPWVLDARQLARGLGFAAVTLLNDLEALAERAGTLTERDVFVLNRGRRPDGPLTSAAVIAAGTGLGMALLHPVAGAWWPVPSEGGHMDLAPRNELEIELLRFLLKRHQRVSVERVVAGPGLKTLYEFFLERGEPKPNPAVLAAIEAPDADGPRIVSEAALEKRCPCADRALDLFVSVYGAAAGNLGLLAVATGGLFIGGGIAPKILERLKTGAFMQALTDKGRLSPLLENMPVKVILDQEAGLMGAARRAVRLELGLVSEG
jgi:glucokinase